MSDSFPGTTIGGLGDHSELKHLLDFLNGNLGMSPSKMNFTVSFTSKDKPHGRILADYIYVSIQTDSAPP